MAATTTKLGIINRGLQLLGSPSIGSLNENSRGARAMSRAYDSILLAELRANTWSFSLKRASLAADPTPPIFGKKARYQLPVAFLFMAPEESTYNPALGRDWEIEGNYIITDDGAPLPLRFVSSDITESSFDPLFAEALSASLAMGCCEEITNSNSKKMDAQNYYKEILKQAKKRNSIEKAPVKTPIPSTISVRD
jgi:hypothetical protein